MIVLFPIGLFCIFCIEVPSEFNNTFRVFCMVIFFVLSIMIEIILGFSLVREVKSLRKK